MITNLFINDEPGWILKELVKVVPALSLRDSGKLRETYQDSWPSERDLNPGLPETKQMC
jgi:hypothetical protein